MIDAVSATSAAQTMSVVAPEPGQLVEVRRRQWIVADVLPSTTMGLNDTRQHRVVLSSVDEDSLGEQLEVIWEIEPGAHAIEMAGLPSCTGQDDPAPLDAFLDAVRWGAATNADRHFLQAPFRSGVSIEDFQLDPLVRAIDMARVNLLIADDVGLGKTIEAGLVVQEMLLRHRARTVLVVCPASLQEKWRVEMAEKFGLEFHVVDSDYVRDLRRERGIHANPWTSFPRLITSIDWVKAGDALRTLRDVLPTTIGYPRKFDILIVDEAHNVAPAASMNYAVDSQRTQFIRRIAPHFQHRLFLTATPHNGFKESFTALLELLDDQRFSRNIEPNEKQLSQVMIRRLKSDLVDKDGQPLYPKRALHALPVPFAAEERAAFKDLDAYCRSREETCGERGAAGAQFVNGILKKRLFSSPAAFASTLARHIETITREKSAIESPLSERILRKAIAKAAEEYSDDVQVEAAFSEAVEEASRFAPAPTEAEKRLLVRLQAWADKAANKPDAKANSILEWLDQHLRHKGEWNDERVILFTEYRTTQQWLQKILAAHGYGGERLAIIHGGMDHEDREAVKAAFQTNPADADVRILLATDAASEGIDLQNYCSKLIHIEIPYNPNVMEQRNGRIDRHGQKAKEVSIWHPADSGVAADDALGGHQDDIIRALRKLDSMRQDMGSVNPVIAPQMAGLIEGSRKTLETRVAEIRAERARRFLRSERDLKERIARLHERLEETQNDFHLTPDRIRNAVVTALALDSRPALRAVILRGAPEGVVFELPALTGSWARCAEGLRHPHTGVIRPITFDHNVAKGRDDVVLVHLNHRLVQSSLRLLRAEVWTQTDVKRLHRIGVRRIEDAALTDPVVIVASRLVITGGSHHRLHEEVTLAGGFLQERGFTREPRVGQVNEWMERSAPVIADDRLMALLKERYDRSAPSIMQTADARSRERLRNLENTLEGRKRQEIENIVTILDDLEGAIQRELKEDKEPEQLSLFSEDERLQVRRDHEALQARLARIPLEKREEEASIRQRFGEYRSRTFPVAAFLIVPDAMVEALA